jgi:predicted nucleic acid-binding protein
MRTALDTNILSAVWSGEPSASAITAQLSKARAQGALVVSAPVFVELSATPAVLSAVHISAVNVSAVHVNVQFVEKLLSEMAITVDFNLGEDVWHLAGTSFAAYAIRRRRSGGGSPKRLLADFLIASHAMLKAERLMTLDPNRYGLDFPNLRLT